MMLYGDGLVCMLLFRIAVLASTVLLRGTKRLRVVNSLNMMSL